MEIPLENVDQVRSRTGCTYEEAKTALEQLNGNVLDAVIAIEKGNHVSDCANQRSHKLTQKIKAMVQEGNVTRVRIMHREDELANIPLNAGIVGGVLGVLAGPVVVLTAAIAAVVAKFGFDCRLEIFRKDGTVEEICPEDEDLKESENGEESLRER